MAVRELTIAVCQIDREAAGRWFIAKDMNCDGVFTISDVVLWTKWVFFLPGDGLLWALMQWQSVATFLELTPAAYSGWGLGIVSVIIWFIAIAMTEAIDSLEKWSTRHYVMFGALAGATIMMLRGWPGSSVSELDWWGYAGYITAGVFVGALMGAAWSVIKKRMDR